MKEFVGNIKNSVCNFKASPINNGGYLIPVLIGAVALISSIVQYIRFIITGGYAEQVRLTKEAGLFGGYEEKFTTGTTGLITAGIVGKILMCLFCIEIVLILIEYFRYSKKVQKILMLVSIGVFIAQGIFATVILNVVVKNIGDASMSVFDIPALWLVPLIQKTEGREKTMLIVCGVIAVAALLLFIMLLLLSLVCRWFVRNTAIALIFAKVVLPVIFWILQNVIPLVTGVVAIIITVVVLWLVFKFGLGALAGAGGESASVGNSSGSTYQRHAEKKESPKMQDEYKKTEMRSVSEKKKADKAKYGSNCSYEADVKAMLGTALYKEHTNTYNYVVRDNGVVAKRICRVDELENGRFHIFDEKTGREIRSSEIPWKN